ncbi:hypothetical protein Tco_0399735 [Tanacetum coccineum]
MLDINYFRDFLNILENYNPIDDEPMWAADRVITLTPGTTITIPETANEFAINEEDFGALLDEGSKILYSIKGTPLEENLFAKFNEFMEITVEENTKTETDEEEIPSEKITFDTDYKIKTSLEEPLTDLELKPPATSRICILGRTVFSSLIMEYLVKISKKERILELKQRHLKITVLTSNTSYPSRKIRRICTCTSQKTTKE